MFHDSNAWPPPPDGYDPPPRRGPPPLDARQERNLMRLIGVLLFTLFVGPLAGSSMIDAVVAMAHAIGNAIR